MRKDAEAFQRAVRELGCLICERQGFPGIDCEIHHILSGGRRLSELCVIGLCPNHHRSGLGEGRYISRHPFKRRFESAYGTETELLELTRKMVKMAADDKWRNDPHRVAA